MFSPFGNSALMKIGASITTSVAQATLPKEASDFVTNLVEMGTEGEELRNRLLNPITGPLLPFCTTGMTFEIGRIMFCEQITSDVILIAAGGTGLAALAETLISSPGQVFAFFTEAFIPVLDDMAKDGKDAFKNNIDYALNKLIGINTDVMKGMTLTQFLTRVTQGTEIVQEHALTGTRNNLSNQLHGCVCNCPSKASKASKALPTGQQIGGSREVLLSKKRGSLTLPELKALARDLSLLVSGNKKELYDRIIYYLNIYE